MLDRLGQQIGNYRLIKRLGQGGVAEVYLAEHLYLGRQAAIKILHMQLPDQPTIDQFRQEAFTIARLEHPNIVRTLDFGVENSTPYLMMDYASGGSLRQKHPRGTQLPLQLVNEYVKQIVSALQYAHDQRIIHRDIKPENMLIGNRGELLLSDFGIATIAHNSNSTTIQNIAGTVPYMAPEQIQAHPRAASDQYALAIVVYEWLSGAVPFQGTNAEIAIKHLTIAPSPLSGMSLAPGVEAVILQALAKDPKDRFPSVQAFANALIQASQAMTPGPFTPLPPVNFPPPVVSPSNHPSPSTPPNNHPSPSTPPVNTPLPAVSPVNFQSPSAPPVVQAPPREQNFPNGFPATEATLVVGPLGTNPPLSSLPPTVRVPTSAAPLVPQDMPPRAPRKRLPLVWSAALAALVLLLIGGVFFGYPLLRPSSPQPLLAKQAVPPPSGPRNVTYFQSWGIAERHYFVKNIDTSGAASKLTTINYAASAMSSDLKCTSLDAPTDYQKLFPASETVDGIADTPNQPLAGNFNQIRELKAKYPHLQVLMMLGGRQLSAHFSDAALPQNVAAYVSSCIDMYIKGNLPGHLAGTAAGIFDGFDIDWEYPGVAYPGNVVRSQDTQDFTGLVAEFRKQLDALGAQVGTHYTLTVTTPFQQEKYSLMQLQTVAQYVNWFNLETYDYYGPWLPQGPTDISAPLYCDPRGPINCVDKTVNGYLAAGVPANKLDIGIPFYGYGWADVPNANRGLYQSSAGMQGAPGIYADAVGTNDYKVLKNLAGYTPYRDSTTQGYWIFNGSTFWSYDDVTEVIAKINYAKNKGLGGATSWAIDGDDGTLVSAIASTFHG